VCGDGGQCVEQEAVMSLDKSIAHGKEHRKPYRGSKAFDPSCRNHGGCPWCEENRKHKFRDKEKDNRGRLQTEDD